jgi:hypothetical protein
MGGRIMHDFFIIPFQLPLNLMAASAALEISIVLYWKINLKYPGNFRHSKLVIYNTMAIIVTITSSIRGTPDRYNQPTKV